MHGNGLDFVLAIIEHLGIPRKGTVSVVGTKSPEFVPWHNPSNRYARHPTSTPSVTGHIPGSSQQDSLILYSR